MRESNLLKFMNILVREERNRLTIALKKYNLNSGSLPVLFRVSDEPGLSQIEISQRNRMNKSLVTRSIKELKTKDIIYIKDDSHDSKKNLIYLSDYGKEIMPLLRKERDLINQSILSHLSETERIILIELLNKLHDKVIK